MIDLTVSPSAIRAVWPGGPGFSRVLFRSTESGSVSNDSEVKLDLHVGTHIESGFHRSATGMTIKQELPASVMILRAEVIDARGSQSVSARHFNSLGKETEFVMFLTDNSTNQLLSKPFVEDYVALDQSINSEIAKYPKLRAVGLDYISIESFTSDGSVHQGLFQNGILAIESLDLSSTEPGEVTAIVSAQILAGAEAAQCQVVILEEADLREISQGLDLKAGEL